MHNTSCCTLPFRICSFVQSPSLVVVWWRIERVELLRCSRLSVVVRFLSCSDIFRTMDTPLWQVHSLPKMCWSHRRWSSPDEFLNKDNKWNQNWTFFKNSAIRLASILRNSTRNLVLQRNYSRGMPTFARQCIVEFTQYVQHRYLIHCQFALVSFCCIFAS